MNASKIAAVALIVVGVLGLAYGGFTYTSDRHELQVGPMSMTMNEKRTVPIPLWAGIGAVLLGTGLLLVPFKRS